MTSNKYIKEHHGDKVWWVDDPDDIGTYRFTFDKKRIFTLFSDYPWKLTAEQKKVFDQENPYWADFFSDRS